MENIGFFINLLKPAGMTSHDAVRAIRKITGEKRTGHLGTLDPGAAGVLPIAVGKGATRLIEYIKDRTKRYRAELLLGKTSETGDLYGEIQESENLKQTTEQEIKETLQSLIGLQKQFPPMASAVKVNGKRLYKYFRSGETVEIPPRIVEIFSIRLVKYKYPFLTIDIDCSEGTYIRSLAADIGQKLGCGALMSFLVRLRSGIFNIKSSVSIEELKRDGQNTNKYTLPEQVLEDYPEIEADEEILNKIKNGNSFRYDKLNFQNGELIRISADSHKIAAMGRAFFENGSMSVKCEKVFIT